MEFFPIIMFVIIAIGIGVAIVSAEVRKNNAAQRNKNSAVSESKPEIIPGYNAPKRVDDPFANNVNKTVNRTSNGNGHKNTAAQKRTDISSQSLGDKAALGTLKDYKPITANVKSHAHTIGREEKNIPTEESMGKIPNLQGCSEHYYSRFVTDIDTVGSGRDGEEVKNALKTAIVLGEVINKPAFKRKDGRIR